MTNRKSSEIELYPAAMTIAGSDSGGGAGIEADLRTFSALGVFGCVALTAVTSQNPFEVRRIDAIPADGVRCQIETVLDRIPVRFAKSGMLLNGDIVRVVAAAVRERNLFLVCDPVMVAGSGARLLDEEAVAAVRDELIPAASWITPNIPEMELLLGRSLRNAADYRDAALEAFDRWGATVLLKTGHAAEEGKFVTDYLCRGGKLFALSSPRLPGGSPHGTGCTLSAALAAALALELPWKQAVMEARAFVHGSIRESVPLAPDLKAMYPPVEDSIGVVRLEPIEG